MSVRGVGRGGRAGSAGKAGAAGGASKASSAGFGAKVDKAESLVGPSGAVGSSNVGGVAAADPVTAQVLDIARQLKEGKLKSRDEATKKLVSDILREKVRLQSKTLTDKIADQLKDDPRLSKTLERMWKRAEEQE
jgi:hypothetical protein